MPKIYKTYARINDGLYAEIGRDYSKYDAISRHIAAVNSAKLDGNLKLRYRKPIYANGEYTGTALEETLVSDDAIHIDAWETWINSHGNPAERFLHKVTI